MKIVEKRVGAHEILEISGRMDGLTAAEIRDRFHLAVTSGKRALIVDFTQVTYLSSAGVRVLIQTHKAFQKTGALFILLSVPDPVAKVLRISGLNQLLTLCPNYESLDLLIKEPVVKHRIESLEIEGIRFSRLSKGISIGRLSEIGSSVKLPTAGYHRYDVVRMPQSEVTYAAGLAALGAEYDEFHPLFGESLTVGHHFFSYPAVQRPAVDYAFFTSGSEHLVNYLYGFAFNGAFSEVLHFDNLPEAIPVDTLIQSVSGFAATPVFGVVMLCVSGGAMWMHLKRSPVTELQPETGEVFSALSFHEWMNYSVDEEEINKTMVVVGVVKRPDATESMLAELFPDAGEMHLHAAIFETGLWSPDPALFEEEIIRVVREFEVEKIVHLLPSSRVKSGFIGIINLGTE